jgi:hypothetical protein
VFKLVKKAGSKTAKKNVKKPAKKIKLSQKILNTKKTRILQKIKQYIQVQIK